MENTTEKRLLWKEMRIAAMTVLNRAPVEDINRFIRESYGAQIEATVDYVLPLELSRGAELSAEELIRMDERQKIREKLLEEARLARLGEQDE